MMVPAPVMNSTTPGALRTISAKAWKKTARQASSNKERKPRTMWSIAAILECAAPRWC
jgi:hypothetical protein